MERGAVRHGLRDGAVVVVADIPDDIAAVRIDMQRSFGLGVAGEARHRIDRIGRSRQCHLASRAGSARAGDGNDPIQTDRRMAGGCAGSDRHGGQSRRPRDFAQRQRFHRPAVSPVIAMSGMIALTDGRVRMPCFAIGRAPQVRGRRDGLELLAPEGGPRQTGQHEHQRADRQRSAEHQMDFLPPPSPAACRPHCKRPHTRFAQARPPHGQAGGDHHQRPASGQFHQQFAGLSCQQGAMQQPDLLHEAVFHAEAAQHRA